MNTSKENLHEDQSKAFVFIYAGAEQATGVRLSAHKKLCAKRVI